MPRPARARDRGGRAFATDAAAAPTGRGAARRGRARRRSCARSARRCPSVGSSVPSANRASAERAHVAAASGEARKRRSTATSVTPSEIGRPLRASARSSSASSRARDRAAHCGARRRTRPRAAPRAPPELTAGRMPTEPPPCRRRGRAPAAPAGVDACFGRLRARLGRGTRRSATLDGVAAARRRARRRRIERDPAVAREPRLDPGVGVDVGHEPLLGGLVVGAGGEPDRDPRRDPAHPQQQRHRAGELLAVAELVLEQERLERIGGERRVLVVAEAVGRRQVAHHPLHERVRRLGLAGERLGERVRLRVRRATDRCGAAGSPPGWSRSRGAAWLPNFGNTTDCARTPSDGGFWGIVNARSDCATSARIVRRPPCASCAALGCGEYTCTV